LKNFPSDLIAALSAPPNDSYEELNLLFLNRNNTKPNPNPNTNSNSNPNPNPNSTTTNLDESPTKLGITKLMIKKELHRFRTEGERIKKLYLRKNFPSRFVDLKGHVAGSCYWGDVIPIDHRKLLIDK
jgi:hypothetical protein